MEAEYGYLKYLITEEIYALKSEQVGTAPTTDDASATASKPTSVMPSVMVTKTESPSISIPKPSPAAAPTPSKNILIVYHYTAAEKLPLDLKILMLKILEAIKVDVKRADFVNEAFKPLPAPVQYYHNVLVFNPKFSTPDLTSTSTYTVQQLDKTRIMVADTLDALNKDKALKVKLWGMLKKMFAVV